MLILVVMLVGGIVGGITAQNKGRNLFFWTLLCGIMPLCLLILWSLPKLAQQGITRPCPFCMRIIPWQAKICGYCGQKVPSVHSHSCEFCGGSLWQGENPCPHCGKRTSLPS